MNKTILDTIHESVRELHEAGVMNDVTLREFDVLCLPPVEIYTPDQIKAIRRKNASQPSCVRRLPQH